MTKVWTLLFLIALPALAQEPVVPQYGKLLLLENREMKPHFELGIDGGLALDNSSEDVYSLNLLANYVATPLFSFGLEITRNQTEEKDYLKRLKAEEDLSITYYTPDWFTQATIRLHLIKGHLNFLNKLQSPFEMSLILGGGLGYNSEQSKSSSLISWGGELAIPFGDSYKGTLGVRHYKSYPFQDEELSFTSLLVGIRKAL